MTPHRGVIAICALASAAAACAGVGGAGADATVRRTILLGRSRRWPPNHRRRERRPRPELNTLFAVRDGVPIGWIHRYPSELPTPVIAEVVEVASAAIRALGLTDGIAFPQLIASSRGVLVVEVAARIAAGQMADLVRHGAGIKVFEIAIAQALAQPVADALVEPRFNRPIAIRFLTASPGLRPVGRVTAIRGLDDVRAAQGVLDAGLYFDVGTRIGPLQVDADRRGAT